MILKIIYVMLQKFNPKTKVYIISNFKSFFKNNLYFSVWPQCHLMLRDDVAQESVYTTSTLGT